MERKRDGKVLSGITLSLTVISVLCSSTKAEPLEILRLAISGTVPKTIDYDALPRLQGEHAVINPVAYSTDYKPGEKLEMNRARGLSLDCAVAVQTSDRNVSRVTRCY